MEIEEARDTTNEEITAALGSQHRGSRTLPKAMRVSGTYCTNDLQIFVKNINTRTLQLHTPTPGTLPYS